MALLEWVAAVAIISNDSGKKKKMGYLNVAEVKEKWILGVGILGISTYFLHLVGQSRPQAASSGSL